MREFIMRALYSLTPHIVGVADGQEALAALDKEPFDVVVTDIVMPNIDGIALALKAVRQYPHLKIVMISGYAQERMRAHNLDALVHRIIAKPFSLEEICEAVQSVIDAPDATTPN